MTTKNNESLIGFDPLAWINDDDETSAQEESSMEQVDEISSEVAD